MTVIYQPPQSHHCGPNQYGYWGEHWNDQSGTVRECDKCGKSWVAYRSRQEPESGQYYMGVYWRRESWLARRRRRKA